MNQDLISSKGSEDVAHEENYMPLLSSLTKDEMLEVLAEGLCTICQTSLQARVQSLTKNRASSPAAAENGSKFPDKASGVEKITSWTPSHKPEFLQSLISPNVNRISSSGRQTFKQSDFEILLRDGLSEPSGVDIGLSEEEKEHARVLQVGRKKGFKHIENINGKATNVLQGLELHTRVFNAEEQKKIVECVYDLQRMGKKGQLSERTYTEPRKWMRGKGRATLQFGCCYNYAIDKNGNPPGIIRDEEVDPLPQMFKQMIKRMVSWHILPATCIPNSCIVNIYDEGDCIPPHIDHHDFFRPFCTVSFLSECNILFGSHLKVDSPGEFSGPVFIPLPVGSVLILSGNGADIAKHCVPAVPAKRISITFRKMDPDKLPYDFVPDPELTLTGMKPPSSSTLYRTPIQHNSKHLNSIVQRGKGSTQSESVAGKSKNPFVIEKDEFPSLASSLRKTGVSNLASTK